MDVSPLPLGSRSCGMPQSGSGDAGTGWEGITGGQEPRGGPRLLPSCPPQALGPGFAPRAGDSRCSPAQLPERVNYLNKYELQRELEHAVVSSLGFHEGPF